MKLEKAIEILDLNIKQRSPRMPPDVLIALRMGTDALSRLRTLRAEPHLGASAPLPDEDL